MTKYKTVLLIFLAFPFCFYAQKNNECITELLKIEEKNSIKNFKEEDKVFYLNYVVTTTDWEDQVIVSNVKVYKGKDNMHFFSEQGQIFQDDNDVFVVLPIQKIIIVNATNKELNNVRLGNDFYQFRKSFLDSCEVTKCEVSLKNPEVKTLELKVHHDMGGLLHIVKMSYKYNTKTEKIISTVTTYNKDYKVKRVEMIFNEINLSYDYKFNKARRQVLDKSGRLLPKFKGYELMDDRDKQKKNK